MFIIFSGHLGLNSSKHLNEQNWHTLPSLKYQYILYLSFQKVNSTFPPHMGKKNLHLTLILLIYEFVYESLFELVLKS